ncbi:hypothetical protein BDO18943_05468 [Burkholderia dolosa]|nr:hypothetical protein BDO18943_05468 [Burkholderia dolosa]
MRDAEIHRLVAVGRHPQHAMIGPQRDHAAQRLHRERQIVDDADVHPRASPIRSCTASSSASSWKLLFAR